MHPTVLKRQELFELRAQAQQFNLNDFLSRISSQTPGQGRAMLRGRGMEYEESRPYVDGDDIRNMDWRVMARTGKPHTKLFREEIKRSVIIYIDLNDSMYFGSKGALKSVYAAHVASLIAWASVDASYPLGFFIQSSKGGYFLAPQRPDKAAFELVDLLERCINAHQSDQPLNFEAGLNPENCLASLRQPAAIFILSDFLRDDIKFERVVNQLSAKHHVISVWIQDFLEQKTWPSGTYPIQLNDDLLSINLRQKSHQEKLSEWQQSYQQSIKAIASMSYLLTVLTYKDLMTQMN